MHSACAVKYKGIADAAKNSSSKLKRLYATNSDNFSGVTPKS